MKHKASHPAYDGIQYVVVSSAEVWHPSTSLSKVLAPKQPADTWQRLMFHIKQI